MAIFYNFNFNLSIAKSIFFTLLRYYIQILNIELRYFQTRLMIYISQLSVGWLDSLTQE